MIRCVVPEYFRSDSSSRLGCVWRARVLVQGGCRTGSADAGCEHPAQGLITLMTGDPKQIGDMGNRGEYDPLLTPEQVAQRLSVSPDWVRDHSSRKEPRLPVIRLGGGPGRAGLLRYRASQIEKFIEEMERRSTRNSRRI